MIFGLLATELPAERRSAALNLVYLPLYAAGIIGPAVGGALAGRSSGSPAAWGSPLSLFGARVVAILVRPQRTAAVPATAARRPMSRRLAVDAPRGRRTLRHRATPPSSTWLRAEIPQ